MCEDTIGMWIMSEYYQQCITLFKLWFYSKDPSFISLSDKETFKILDAIPAISYWFHTMLLISDNNKPERELVQNEAISI